MFGLTRWVWWFFMGRDLAKAWHQGYSSAIVDRHYGLDTTNPYYEELKL